MSALFDLTGKTALITGGTSGIGLAIATAFAEAGAAVVASSENAAACAQTEAELRAAGYKAHGVVCDVSVRENLAGLVAAAEDKLGSIDVLVCNAGIEGPVGPMGTADSGSYQKVFDINLNSAVFLSGLIAPKMAAQGGGSIILMSSLSSQRGNRGIGAYALTKAAIGQLARNLAVEWGPQNVRANAISPGLIRTPFSEKLMGDAEFMERRLRMTPLRRVGEPEEIAAMAVFLAAPGGAFATGQNFIIDGGTIITDGN